MYSPVVSFVFLFTIAATLAVPLTVVDAEYKNHCFYLRNADKCESKTIEINSRVYGCDSEVYFDTEITKIHFKLDDSDTPIIVVQDSNLKSYTIDVIDKIKKEVDSGNLPSCTYVVDNKENTYKIDSGVVSVTGPKGIRTRTIKTDPDLTPVELALDQVTGKLVILSLRKNAKGDTKEGSLFGLDINKVNSVGSSDSELYAERISPIDVVITGFSIYEGFDDFIVGIKLGGKFKLVKLTAVPEDHKCYGKGRKSKRAVEQEPEGEERTTRAPKTTTTSATTTTTQQPHTFSSHQLAQLRVSANVLDKKLAQIIRPFAALLNE